MIYKSDLTYPPYPDVEYNYGDMGANVALMQEYLNACADVYSGINKQVVDGEFGTVMQKSVMRFQKQFGLAEDGIIGVETWNEIGHVYDNLKGTSQVYVKPHLHSLMLTMGDTGDDVRFAQSYYNGVALSYFPEWILLMVDGHYGPKTSHAIELFQETYSLEVDGKVGDKTWDMLVEKFNSTLCNI